jgi:probable F420-dependent oxidoreductase
MMSKVAAEVADGLLVHAFTSERYLREIALPAVDSGLSLAGRSRRDFQIFSRRFVISGDTEEQIAAAARETKKQIAFYASTAAYRPVLELHGWGDLQSDLAGLSRCGAWDQMSDLITDEVLDTFAVSGAPEQIPSLLQQRFGGMLDRLSLHTPYDPDSEVTARILAGLKQDVSNA